MTWKSADVRINARVVRQTEAHHDGLFRLQQRAGGQHLRERRHKGQLQRLVPQGKGGLGDLVAALRTDHHKVMLLVGAVGILQPDEEFLTRSGFKAGRVETKPFPHGHTEFPRLDRCDRVRRTGLSGSRHGQQQQQESGRKSSHEIICCPVTGGAAPSGDQPGGSTGTGSA